MSTNSSRVNMKQLASRTRAYFAPVDRNTNTPTIFDPAVGLFNPDSPSAPWVDLGAIANFRRISRTPIDAVRAGLHGVPVEGVRGALSANLEFDFCEWGKLQLALATGSEQMNVLAADVNATSEASGGGAAAAVALLPGSTAQELQIGPGAAGAFSVGEVVAADLDYQQQTGYVGTGIAGAYIRDASDVLHSADYVRRVTFNVGRVQSVTETSLILEQPLIGGAPLAGAAVQKVVAFVDREGGVFFQQWSGLFLFEEASGGRVCFYYPRLSPQRANEHLAEKRVEIEAGLDSLLLHARFVAFPHTDTNDRATVLCYRSYFPASGAALY